MATEVDHKFFQSGSADDDAYIFNRDHESRLDLRINIEKRWAACKHLCGDTHFLELAKQNFNGATWQLFLMSELLERKHNLLPTSSDEPDIKVKILNRDCWIEAAAADAGTGENEVSTTPIGQVGTINPNQIKLRLTSKIRDKALSAQYSRWVDKQTVKENDFYIIGLNGSEIPNADIAGGPVNVLEQCLFGLGEYAWQIEARTGKVLSAQHARYH